MTRPTADSTAAAESWLRSRQTLEALVEEALLRKEIARALTREKIPVEEARAAILEDPGVLGRLRSRTGTLQARQDEMTEWGLRSGRMRGASLARRMTVAAVAVVGYVVLLTASWPAIPFAGNVLALLGFLATIGFAVGLCGEDVWTMVQNETQLPDVAGWPSFPMDKVVLPELRQFIDSRRAPDYSTTLSIKDMRHLYRDDEDAPIIITTAGQRLRRVVERSTSDAVAIAGYRGVGKTTAIRAVARGLFCDPGVAPPMHVIASAPSRYEARDFVLHLHASLAKQVLALTGRLLRKKRTPRRRTLGRLTVFALYVLAGCVVVAPIVYLVAGGSFEGFLTDARDAGAALVAEFPRHVFAPLSGDVALARLQTGDTAVRISLLVLYFGLLAGAVAVLWQALRLLVRLLVWLPGALRRAGGYANMPRVADLHDLAGQQLDRIRFLQTYTTGWSGKVGIPIGNAEVAWSRGGQRAEQQLTHPEVVEAFREFAALAADVLIGQSAVERIVIAVDELDKIAEPEKAHEFVNDIKGIFGVEGCLFLVAVSEDAISAFERRGIPVRDAFDSAFSEMIRMDAFTLAESRRWLSRRLVGVPEPFSCLCHCLSGGLPRDLRRSTIDMIDAVRETGERDLTPIATLMIDRELDRKAHAFAAAARRLDDHPEVSAHVANLLLIHEAGTPADLVTLAYQLAPDEDSTIPSLRWQAACFVLFCATLAELFTSGLTKSSLDGRVELLGTARAQLSVDPRVAWKVVCEVRARFGYSDSSAGP